MALQLQIPTIALGPVIAVVSRDAGLTLGQAGALTSIPVLCFAVLTPVAARAVGTIGINRALVLASVTIGAGVVVRSLGTLPALFGGSILLGSAVALVNIALPTLITRRYRHRSLLMNAIQTSSINVGSATAALVSAPLVASLGWQLGLGVWSVVSLVAAAVWWWRNGIARPERLPASSVVTTMAEAIAEDDDVDPAARAASSGRSVPGWRVPMAWVLGVAFVMHGGCYFAMSSWLPLLLQERSGLSATTAGACVAAFLVIGVIGPVLLPAVLKLPGMALWKLMTLTSIGWLVCLVLLATAPALWPLAVLIGGLVQGASYTVIATFAVHVAADEDQSRGIQATFQTIGFAGAAVMPVLIGAVRDSTGGWDAPLWVLVGVAVALVVVGGVASRLLVRHDAAVPAAA